jgi:hypothetical protein
MFRFCFFFMILWHCKPDVQEDLRRKRQKNCLPGMEELPIIEKSLRSRGFAPLPWLPLL